MRLFIGVELAEDVKSILENYQNTLKQESYRGNYSRKENLHLTLFFIGETSADDLSLWEGIISDVAKRTSTFALELAGVNSFVRNRRHIVYVEEKKHKELLNLWDTLIKEINKRGINSQVGEYTSHITLAREAEFNKSFDEIKKGFVNLKLTSPVQDIILFESTRINGVLTYLPLKKEKLKLGE